jgi:hypothetical protein
MFSIITPHHHHCQSLSSPSSTLDNTHTHLTAAAAAARVKKSRAKLTYGNEGRLANDVPSACVLLFYIRTREQGGKVVVGVGTWSGGREHSVDDANENV